MTPLRTASFSELFATAFVVNLAFHLLIALPGFVAAFADPSLFQWNGRRLEDSGGALGVLALLLLIFTVVNAAASALGSLLWMALRPLLGRRRSA